MYNQYTPYLCSLDDVKQFRVDSQDSVTYTATHNALLAKFIRQASQEVTDRILKRFPLPFQATFRFHARQDVKVYDTLLTEHAADLLVATTVTNGNGTVITSTDYVLEPANRQPKQAIRLLDSAADQWTYDDDPEEAISVLGFWGYVPHYDTSAWTDSTDTVQDNPLSASATTLNVTDGTLFDSYQYIRIASEFLLVTSITANALTVQRGVLGTTAASHVQGTQIDHFNQHPTIRDAVTEYANYLYTQKDRLPGEQVVIFDGGALTTTGPAGRLVEALRSHRRWTV